MNNLALITAIISVVILTAVFKKQFKTKSVKNIFLIVGIAGLAVGGLGVAPYLGINVPSQLQFFEVGGAGNGNPLPVPTGGLPNYQPTASYSTIDKYSTTSVSGTSYYKANNNKATTTAVTNVNLKDKIKYWVSNTTYWVKPEVVTINSQTSIIQADAWANSSATVTLYDPVNRQTTTSGAYNTSLGANDDASVEITYDGTAEGSAGAFGGVMIFERNSTISSVKCTGDQLLKSNPYHVTYTVTATTNTYDAFAYDSSLDDGSGAPRTINCEVKNGASAVGAGSAYYVKFIPANYYVTQAGDIVLDTEKNADGDTTRTGSTINLPSATANWGA